MCACFDLEHNFSLKLDAKSPKGWVCNKSIEATKDKLNKIEAVGFSELDGVTLVKSRVKWN